MCTVSTIRSSSLLRLVVNRDELRTRAIARPPARVELNGIPVLMPIDPDSGGSWVACNAAGLALALLNVNASGLLTIPGRRSRGEIVPRLAACTTIEEAIAQAAALDAGAFAPFRLVGAQGAQLFEFAPPAAPVRRSTRMAQMFTSSGLGDDLVEAPRRELFERIVQDGHGDPRARQDLFHSHQWPDRPHTSVLMSRADAHTVSRTVMEIGRRTVMMSYAGAPDWVVTASELTRDR